MNCLVVREGGGADIHATRTWWVGRWEWDISDVRVLHAASADLRHDTDAIVGRDEL